MTKRKTANWLETLGVIVLFTLLGFGSASGAYLFYYLHVQSTGVTFKETGKPVSRAKLLDLIIVSAIQANKNANPAPTPAPSAPADGR